MEQKTRVFCHIDVQELHLCLYAGTVASPLCHVILLKAKVLCRTCVNVNKRKVYLCAVILMAFFTAPQPPPRSASTVEQKVQVCVSLSIIFHNFPRGGGGRGWWKFLWQWKNVNSFSTMLEPPAGKLLLISRNWCEFHEFLNGNYQCVALWELANIIQYETKLSLHGKVAWELPTTF